MLALALLITLSPGPGEAPFTQPQLDAHSGRVALAFASGTKILFSESADGGRHFSAPVRVAELEKLAAGRHRGPRVAVAGGGVVVSAISHGSGDLRAWRSSDGGRTWSGGTVVNDVPRAAREGLHAMAAAGDRVFVVWLDLRQPGMRLYGAASADGGATWSKNVLVYASPDGHICECCHPSAAIAGDGTIYVMWRNWLGGNRDMYLTISADGGKTFREPRKLGSSSWKLDACPMDGGGLTLQANKPVTVWRRGSEVFVARPDTGETRLSTGRDATVTVGRGGQYAAWTESGAIWGVKPEDPAPREIGPGGAYAQLSALPDGGVLAAWETPAGIQIQKYE